MIIIKLRCRKVSTTIDAVMIDRSKWCVNRPRRDIVMEIHARAHVIIYIRHERSHGEGTRERRDEAHSPKVTECNNAKTRRRRWGGKR